MDGLRGIAVLMVFGYHLHERGLMPDPFSLLGLPVKVPWLFLSGFLGVEVFFFISGFVLFYPYARHLIEGRPKPGIAHFYLRRSLKIVPSYVVVVCAMALIAPQNVPANESLIAHVLAHTLFIHGFFPNTFTSIVGPLWSLTVEVEYYVLFPVICAIWLRDVWAGFALMIVISAVYRWHLASTGFAGEYWHTNQLPAFLNLFAAGMFSSYLLVRARSKSWWFTGRPIVATVICALALTGVYAMLGAVIPQGGGPPVWTWQNDYRDVTAALLGVAAITGPFAVPQVRLIIDNPATRWVAFVSYNLYLWNKPLIIMFTSALDARGPWPYGSAAGIVAIVVIALAVAWFFTTFVEQPFLIDGWRRLWGPVRAAHNAEA
jgi:peptidoglycan/LPS O-acetylase OafA/YrhL